MNNKQIVTFNKYLIVANHRNFKFRRTILHYVEDSKNWITDSKISSIDYYDDLDIMRKKIKNFIKFRNKTKQYSWMKPYLLKVSKFK